MAAPPRSRAAVRMRMSRLAQVPDDHPAWDAAAHYVSGMCATLVMVASPQRIVLGGGLAAAQDAGREDPREPARAARRVRADDFVEKVNGLKQFRWRPGTGTRRGSSARSARVSPPPAAAPAARAGSACGRLQAPGALHRVRGGERARRAQDCQQGGARARTEALVTARGGKGSGKERAKRRSRFFFFQIDRRAKTVLDMNSLQRPAALRLPKRRSQSPHETPAAVCK